MYLFESFQPSPSWLELPALFSASAYGLISSLQEGSLGLSRLITVLNSGEALSCESVIYSQSEKVEYKMTDSAQPQRHPPLHGLLEGNTVVVRLYT